MDFDQLYQLLPKPSMTWTVNDIEIWLRFIGLQNYAQAFRMASVDGSCLADLTNDDIKNELSIESKIITKKLIHWVTQGICQYDEFLLKKEKQLKNASIHGKNMLSSTSKGIRSEKIQKMVEKDMLEGYECREGTYEKRQKKRQYGNEREMNELIIKQCQSSIYNCYSLKEQGGIIGRNSKNQIHIVDENVSRFHAQIDYEKDQYLIYDLGSSSGTFLRITEKTQLIHGQIIQMGSNQFFVDLTNEKTLNLKIIEGPNTDQMFTLTLARSKNNVGRKNTNEISFIEDQHLSNIHATIFAVEGIWYIEDLGTTNGQICFKSAPGFDCHQRVSKVQNICSLGNSLTYECQLTNANRKTEKQKNDKCSFCRVAERDCIFMPCKHNVCCFKCSQLNQLANCTTCGSAITDQMKIYKV